jgi:hypothetical protein
MVKTLDRDYSLQAMSLQAMFFTSNSLNDKQPSFVVEAGKELTSILNEDNISVYFGASIKVIL